MADQEELFMVCDDANNVPFSEIDLAAVPADVLAEIDAILTGESERLAAA